MRIQVTVTFKNLPRLLLSYVKVPLDTKVVCVTLITDTAH